MNRFVLAGLCLAASCGEDHPDCICEGKVLEMKDATVAGKVTAGTFSKFVVKATVKSRGSAPKGQTGTMTVFVTAKLQVTYTAVAKDGENTVTHHGQQETFSVEAVAAEHTVGCPAAEFTDTVELTREDFTRGAAAQIVEKNGEKGIVVTVSNIELALIGEELKVGAKAKTHCTGVLHPKSKADGGIGGVAPLTLLEDGTIEPTKVVIGNTKVEPCE